MSEPRQEPLWEKLLSSAAKIRAKVRIRTSTAMLILAFVAASWLYEINKPEPAPPQPPPGDRKSVV